MMKEEEKEGKVRCSERFQTVSNGGLRGLSVAGGVKGCYATGEQQRLLSSQNSGVYRAERKVHRTVGAGRFGWMNRLPEHPARS